MLIDIKGKINEKRLSYANTLLPLFEAIVNSIQAIEEDSSTKKGIIEITLIRANQEKIDFSDQNAHLPILDFIIKDNGIGFTEKNFESFNFAHSTYKEKKGGKGIGRFLWLRAFKKVVIESRFRENNNWQLRKFNFEPTKDGIEKHNLESVNGAESRYTIVHLKGLKEDFQKWCNTNTEDIALKIIEHCFVYFLRADCPRLIIKDGNTEIVVNDLFGLFTKGQVINKSLSIRNEKFETNIVKLYSSRIDNKVHYCAHTREVQSEKLNIEIPELDTYLVDENKERFSIAVYVTGNYLNEKVNEERTLIQFAKDSDEALQFPNEVSQEEILKIISSMLREEFSLYLDSLSEERFERIKRFVQDHPRYRQLMKYRIQDLKRVPSNLSDDKMEIELFKIQQGLDFEVKKEANEILRFIENIDDKESFNEKFNQLYDKIIEVGNSKLSEYIIHRKLVLDLLEKHIKRSDDGKFQKEDAVHRLIFPLQKLSDDIGFEEHNLWVIDERLSYHKYLASDKRFKALKELKSNSAERPDIIVFNKPFAFTNDDKPYGSIVLIEFKRPMRDDYSEKENPISQINRYAGEISANEVKDKDNRTLDFRPNTPIYAYIVCDLTKNMRQFAKDAGYKPMPNLDGYFFFNDNYNLYVEIISFDKLINDSKQRNKVLFEKLNLPTH
jgi:hypothetical protein